MWILGRAEGFGDEVAFCAVAAGDGWPPLATEEVDAAAAAATDAVLEQFLRVILLRT